MPTGLPTPPSDAFLYSGNSGTYAMEAAALMGFKEIRLLGIDLRIRSEKLALLRERESGGVLPRDKSLAGVPERFPGTDQEGDQDRQ